MVVKKKTRVNSAIRLKGKRLQTAEGWKRAVKLFLKQKSFKKKAK